MIWHQGRPTRREIITHLPAAAAFLAAHEALGQAAAPKSVAPARPREVNASPRIQAIRLLTAAPLADMRNFVQHDDFEQSLQLCKGLGFVGKNFVQKPLQMEIESHSHQL